MKILPLIFGGTLAAVTAGAQPNILMVLSDDHSADHVGCYGNPDIKTPHLDRFATQGIRFERAYVTSPQSAPSRASIFTGCSPVAVDMTRFYVNLDRRYRTFPEYLRAKGYFTGVAGRSHHMDGASNAPVGDSFVEEYLVANNLRTFPERVDLCMEVLRINENSHDIHAQFYEFMRLRDRSKPFYLQLSYTDPHRPYTAPKVHDPRGLTLPEHYPDTKLVREDLAAYYDEIHRCDRDFGEILAWLDREGLSDNTIVIFIGDNGGAQFMGKGTLYEYGVRVPLLVRWPGTVPAGSVCRQVVSGEDFAPTFLEINGIGIPPEMSGKSMLPLLKGEDKPTRKYAFSERGAHGSVLPTGSNNFDLQRCIIGDRYKLIYNITWQLPPAPVDFAGTAMYKELAAMNARGELSPLHSRLYFGQRPMFELYDLQSDPREFNNLIDNPEMAAVQDELLKELTYWMIRERDYPPLPAQKVSNPKK